MTSWVGETRVGNRGTTDIDAVHRKQQRGQQFPQAEEHRGHWIHPHDHIWLIRDARPVLKPCTGTWFCIGCKEFFDGPRCYVLRNDSGWPVGVMPGIEC